jgi:hypothetical protein
MHSNGVHEIGYEHTGVQGYPHYARALAAPPASPIQAPQHAIHMLLDVRLSSCATFPACMNRCRWRMAAPVIIHCVNQGALLLFTFYRHGVLRLYLHSHHRP